MIEREGDGERETERVREKERERDREKGAVRHINEGERQSGEGKRDNAHVINQMDRHFPFYDSFKASGQIGFTL